MRTPPFLCAVAALFWGWQSGHPVPGVLVALLLEAPRVIRMRLDVGTAQVARAFDLGLAALIVLTGVLTLRGTAQEAVLEAAGWLPAALLPFVLIHRLGGGAVFDVRALWWRSQRTSAPPMPPLAVDPGWIYVPLCLLAASVGAERTPVFYAGAALIGLWMLFPARSRRVPVALWAVVALSTAALGYMGQVGLTRLQKFVIDTTVDLISDADTDPSGRATAIGEIGELKFSGRILVRVSPADGQAPPRYLHRATYDRYAAGSWYVRDAPMEAVKQDRSPGAFTLAPPGPEATRTVIVTSAGDARMVLPLPLGTSSLHGVETVSLHRNRLGTVEARAPASMLRFEALAVARTAGAGAPTAQDLAIPKSEQDYLLRWLSARGLAGRPPGEVARELARQFQVDFRYSLYQPREAAGPLPVRTFLERTKAGHCEYFATATVLLLRAAGVPARYSVGYVVDEWSPLEGMFVVRARHAHAWARAWVDGAWQELDTTPSTWVAAESDEASSLQPLLDLFSLAYHRFRAWRAGDAGIPPWIVVVVAVAVLVLAARRLRRRARTDAVVAGPSPGRPGNGLDSEFLTLVERLERDGHRREPGEPVAVWVARIASAWPPDARAELETLAALHRRHRFDPRGLVAGERAALASGVGEWLRRRPGDDEKGAA